MAEKVIAAISTPCAPGGIGVIRISGAGAIETADRLFRPVSGEPLHSRKGYTAAFGTLWDEEGAVDDVIATVFRGPKSYTGEDVVELSCHGGLFICRRVLRAVLKAGASPAGPGEFTKRAFLNGKLSLASAEGIADMINGESEAEVKAGYLLYSEKLTEKVRLLQARLKEVLAGIDASIDYPEEDLEESETDEIRTALKSVLGEVTVLLAGYAKGKKIKSGVTVALCGKPNTGKSSLLNRLLGYEKAIVSDVAGTTRDAVEGILEIEGTKFNLYDTAGVRESGDRIESIGIEKAENIVRAADVVVFVADSAAGTDAEDARVLELARDKPRIRYV